MCHVNYSIYLLDSFSVVYLILIAILHVQNLKCLIMFQVPTGNSAAMPHVYLEFYLKKCDLLGMTAVPKV